MSKIIACIDHSSQIDSICELAAFAASKTQKDLAILHVIPTTHPLEKQDLSGAIGLGSQSGLLNELVEADEIRGKAEIKDGQLMLERAKNSFSKNHLTNLETLHLRGSLEGVLSELDPALIVMGKSDKLAGLLGSNVEKVAKEINKPVLVTPKISNQSKIEKFLIAFDGSQSAITAVNYVASSNLLKGLECHLLEVSQGKSDNQQAINEAQKTLENAGFKVTSKVDDSGATKDVVVNYISQNNINLLTIGAYGHSKLHQIIFGSTTEMLIKAVNVPLLLLS